MKLIKIDDYWVIVSDEESEDRKVCVSYNKIDKSPIIDWYYQGDPYVYPVSSIIASNHPKTKRWFPTITFSDEVAKELGIINSIDKCFKNSGIAPKYKEIYEIGVEDGYNQALSDNKSKFNPVSVRIKAEIARKEHGRDDASVYYCNGLKNALTWLQKVDTFDIYKLCELVGRKVEQANNYSENVMKKIVQEYIQSLTKQEYEVELEMEFKTIECHNYNGNHLGKDCNCKSGDLREIYKPLITNNSVKVIKIYGTN